MEELRVEQRSRTEGGEKIMIFELSASYMSASTSSVCKRGEESIVEELLTNRVDLRQSRRRAVRVYGPKGLRLGERLLLVERVLGGRMLSEF